MKGKTRKNNFLKTPRSIKKNPQKLGKIANDQEKNCKEKWQKPMTKKNFKKENHINSDKVQKQLLKIFKFTLKNSKMPKN